MLHNEEQKEKEAFPGLAISPSICITINCLQLTVHGADVLAVYIVVVKGMYFETV